MLKICKFTVICRIYLRKAYLKTGEKMIKKIAVIFLTLIFIATLFCSCSQESKFGIEELCKRTNENFGTSLKSEDFFLAENGDERFLIYENGNTLISVSIDTNNTVKGVSVLLTSDGNINDGIELFYELCCVFTCNEPTSQKEILDSCGITADKTEFADSNSIFTVGKYKYVVVCNRYSVTLFCDRV